MANLRLCAKNAIDSATVTASPSAVSSLPVTNLQIAARAPKWRSTSAAQQVITAHWSGGERYLNHVGLFIHNLSHQATWRVQAFSDQAATVQIEDSGTVEAFDTSDLGYLDQVEADADAYASSIFSIYYFAARCLAKALKVTITDTGNADGYVEASRLWAGDYTELTYNAGGESLSPKDDAEQDRTDGGTLHTGAGIAYRELSIDLPVIAAADRSALVDMMRYAGKRRQLFVALYPGVGAEKERDFTMLAKVIELPDIGKLSGEKWGGRIRLAES